MVYCVKNNLNIKLCLGGGEARGLHTGRSL